MSKPVQFPSMVLPDISQTDALSRASKAYADYLVLFLEELTSGRRGQSTNSNDDWVAQNFIVNITLKQYDGLS